MRVTREQRELLLRRLREEELLEEQRREEDRSLWKKAFGVTVRRLRHLAGVSQAAMAHEVKLSPSYASNLESGEISPGLDMILRLALYFGLENQPVAFMREVDREYVKLKTRRR